MPRMLSRVSPVGRCVLGRWPCSWPRRPSPPKGPSATGTTRTRTIRPRAPIRSRTSGRPWRRSASCSSVSVATSSRRRPRVSSTGRPGGRSRTSAVPDPDAVVAYGEADAFYPLDYTMGVTHSGMLLAGEATGDPRFREFTQASPAVHRRSPALLPGGRGARRWRAERDLRGHHRDRLARRQRLDVRGADQGASGRRRPGPRGGDRPLDGLHRAPPVPDRRRHAGPPAAAAGVALGGRPLHERARARADGGAQRGARVVRRRRPPGAPVPSPPLGPPGRTLRARTPHEPAAQPGVLLGAGERLGHDGHDRAARGAAAGSSGARAAARDAPGPHQEHRQAAVGRERAVAPDAGQARLVPGDLGLRHLRVLRSHARSTVATSRPSATARSPRRAGSASRPASTPAARSRARASGRRWRATTSITTTGRCRSTRRTATARSCSPAPR